MKKRMERGKRRDDGQIKSEERAKGKEGQTER